MMKSKTRILYLFTLLCLTTFLATAQTDSTLLNNMFKFKDGVYLTFKQFKNNKPYFPLDSVEIDYEITDFDSQVAIYEMRLPLPNDKYKKFDLKKIWGVCINGVPYINHKQEVVLIKLKKHPHLFTEIKIRGAICLFTLEKFITSHHYPMLTFGGIGTGGYSQTKYVADQKVFKLTDGTVNKLTPQALRLLIADDVVLSEQFEQEKKQKKMMGWYLNQYNKRNPVMMD